MTCITEMKMGSKQTRAQATAEPYPQAWMLEKEENLEKELQMELSSACKGMGNLSHRVERHISGVLAQDR